MHAMAGRSAGTGDGPPVTGGTITHLAGLVVQHAERTGASRVILGLAGGPGSGMSALASRLAGELARTGDGAAVVPLDGFQLALPVLTDLSLLEQRGAPETFDVQGYLALLQRLRAQPDHVVYAPGFSRKSGEPVAGAIPIAAGVRYVITEGSYLLLEQDPWSAVRPLLDAAWFLDPGDDIRVNRLVRQHIQSGDTPTTALRRATSGVDAANAALAAATRYRADLVIDS